MLNFKKIVDDKFIECPQQDFIDTSDTKVLFLGGLLHFNGHGFGKTLSTILQDLTNTDTEDNAVSIFSCHRLEDNIGQTASDMYAFVKNGTITKEARHIFDTLILPSSLKNALIENPDQASETLKDHLSSIRIIGYSYGTSLVQQIERLCTSFLKENGLENHPEIRGAFTELRVLNIGPVAHLHDSTGQRFGAERQDLDNAESLFSQLFFYKHNDKIMQDCLSDDLVRPMSPQEGRAYNAVGNHKTGYICDFLGDDYIRRIGKSRFASGVENVRVDNSFDFEAHDLRLYTNVLRVKGDMATYPSTAIAEILHGASKLLVHAPTAEDYVTQTLENAANPFAHDERKESVLSSRADFKKAVEGFSQTHFAETPGFVTAHLRRLQRHLDRR